MSFDSFRNVAIAEAPSGKIPLAPAASILQSCMPQGQIRQGESWNVSTIAVLRYATLAMPLALLSDIPNSIGQIYYLAAKVILYCLLLSRLFSSTQQTLTFLLMISIVGQDVMQTNEQQESGMYLAASVWQGQLGFLRPSWFFLAFYFVAFLKAPLRWLDRPVYRMGLFFATVPFVTAWIYGSFEGSQAFSEITNDVKHPLLILTTIVLARNHLKTDPAFAGQLLAVFIGSALARHALDLTYFGMGVGAMFGDVLRVSLDSTKGTAVFLLLLSMHLVLQRSQHLLGSLMAIASGMLLIIYGTRGLWVAALLGVAIFFCIMRPGKRFISFAVILALTCGSIYVLSRVRPENVELAVKRFGSKTIGGADNFFEDQDPCRYMQIVNAWDATVVRKSLLWGSGYGAYYTESAIRFPPELRIGSAFSADSIRSGRYYTIHHFVLKTLFKFGLIGFLMLAGLWILPGLRCFTMCRNAPWSLSSDLVIPLTAFLPTTMLEMSWTSKGMIVSGFAIVICMSAYDSFRHRERGLAIPRDR